MEDARLVEILAQHSDGELTEFFEAHDLGDAFQAPGREWSTGQRITRALLAARRRGQLAVVAQEAKRRFGLGNASNGPSEPDKPNEPSGRGTPSSAPKNKADRAGTARARGPRKVFIVHGRDHNARDQVENVIRRCVNDIEIVMLSEQANLGRTIIEKFESYARSASYAVILMTADDVGGLRDSETPQLRSRARQNVLFELGYFAGKLRMKKITILCEDGIEIPSDVVGVGYTVFDRNAGTWRSKLLKEMRGAGLDADANQL
jgi:predicted nucleotide-binding protein